MSGVINRSTDTASDEQCFGIGVTIDPTCRIEMLGGLKVFIDGKVIRHFRTQRAGMLLAYLAMNRGRACSRSMLGELLWPDEDPNIQRTRLRYELTVLRSIIGQELFVRSGNSFITLQDNVITDINEWEALIEEAVRSVDSAMRIAPLSKAVTMYKGGLLPDARLPTSAYTNANWLEAEQDRVKDIYFDAVSRLVLDLESLGQHADAQRLRTEAAMLDPSRSLPTVPVKPPVWSLEPSGHGNGIRFFGRNKELALISAWLADTQSRLLTLCGFGGIGKTRLALEGLAKQSFVYITLDGICSTEEIITSIHAALGLPSIPNKTQRRQIRDEFRLRGQLVLLLDGAEHAIREVSRLALELLDCSPTLAILVTSRRPLRMAGEQVISLRALSEPEAVALFVNRAQLVRQDFGRSDIGQKYAREIARMLEGVPLALELAAARATVLGPSQIREQLSRQLQFLVSVRPRAQKHHRSLQAVLEWSVGLLTARTRQTLGRLSVFCSPFHLDAATAVCGSELPVLDALEELRLHALLEVSFDSRDEEALYRLPLAVGEYAASLLEVPIREDVLERHLSYYEQEADEIGRLVSAQQWEIAAYRVQRSLKDFRAAMAYALRSGIGKRPLRLLDNLGLLFFELGLWSEFVSLVRPLDSQLDNLPPSPQAARIHGWRGALARRRGDGEAAWRFWEGRLSMLRSLRDEAGVVNTLFEMVGQAIDEQDMGRAKNYLAEGSIIIQAGAAPEYELNAIVLSARLAALEGNPDRALASISTAEAFLQESHSAQNLVYVFTYLSAVLVDVGQAERAERFVIEGITLCRGQSRWFTVGILCFHLARLRESQHRLSEAAVAYTLAAAIHEDIESRYAVDYRRHLSEFSHRCHNESAVAEAVAAVHLPLSSEHLQQHLDFICAP